MSDEATKLKAEEPVALKPEQCKRCRHLGPFHDHSLHTEGRLTVICAVCSQVDPLSRD